LEAYFFIPATKLSKVPDIRSLGVAAVILDLEDAIAGEEWEAWLARILAEKSFQDCYLRLPLHNLQGQLDLVGLEPALVAGFHRLVLPKLRNASEVEAVFALGQKYQLIDKWDCMLLVEDPLLWVELPLHLGRWKEYLSALALGSHDLLQQVGSTHEAKHLLPLQQQLLMLAKAYNLAAVDLAVMELEDEEYFAAEIRRGFELGYTAKFILHPWQLQQLRRFPFYTAEDLAWAKAVETEWRRVASTAAFAPVRIHGQVVEKPHLERMQRILHYFAEKTTN
jgi:citrate lyase beta subunit